MLRWLAAVIAAVLASILAAAPLAAQYACTPKRGLAPADEYFGPQRLSPLGVPVHIAFDDNHYSDQPNNDPYRRTSAWILKDTEGIEAAVREIEYCYPEDTLLPRAVSSLYRLYVKLGSAGARRAEVAKKWLEAKYPGSPAVALTEASRRLSALTANF